MLPLNYTLANYKIERVKSKITIKVINKMSKNFSRFFNKILPSFARKTSGINIINLCLGSFAPSYANPYNMAIERTENKFKK